MNDWQWRIAIIQLSDKNYLEIANKDGSFFVSFAHYFGEQLDISNGLSADGE